jgi:ABC-type branched-subunit amino acid transport system ATPase component
VGDDRRETNVRLNVDMVRAGYGAVTIVRDICLQLQAGTVTALLGPNGAGKSTMCKVIVGILPTTAGRIELDGVDITLQPCWWRAGRGLFLAPEGRGIFPSLTVEDNLRVSIHGATDRARVYERFPHLGRRRRLPAGSLSGGEQQMLALAPALIKDPEILIADEPTLGLAPRVASEVLGLFRELREAGTTILLVGESPRGLIDIADHAVLMHGGRVAWTGDAKSLDSATLEQAYFNQGRVAAR